MPINIQSDLPVKEILEKENIFVMDESRASHHENIFFFQNLFYWQIALYFNWHYLISCSYYFIVVPYSGNLLQKGSEFPVLWLFYSLKNWKLCHY